MSTQQDGCRDSFRQGNQIPEEYVKYLRDSRKKLDEILGSEVLEPKLHEGQLTIFDFMGAN